MTHIRTKLLIGGIVLLTAVGYLAFAGVNQGWVYYVTVDQFLADSSYQTQRVRLTGNVAAEGLVSQPGRLMASFTLLGEKAQLPVEYQGVIPDMFKPDVEVVLEGALEEDGVFRADMMMTKCASKYEAAPDGQSAHPADIPMETQQ